MASRQGSKKEVIAKTDIPLFVHAVAGRTAKSKKVEYVSGRKTWKDVAVQDAAVNDPRQRTGVAQPPKQLDFIMGKDGQIIGPIMVPEDQDHVQLRTMTRERKPIPSETRFEKLAMQEPHRAATVTGGGVGAGGGSGGGNIAYPSTSQQPHRATTVAGIHQEQNTKTQIVRPTGGSTLVRVGKDHGDVPLAPPPIQEQQYTAPPPPFSL